MKSLKVKLTVIILALITITLLVSAALVLYESLGVTNEVIETLVEERLVTSENMLETYLEEQYGSLQLNQNGELMDQSGHTIAGDYEYIDKLAEEMHVVATVFVKNGSNYTRVLTTILDEKGERAVGTNLDAAGQAYQTVAAGNAYFGEAEILGSQYMTRYVPMYDASKQLIGIYFVGVHIEDINSILDQGTANTLRATAMVTIVLLILATAITLFVSKGITKPIQNVTGAAQKIADGDFDVELSVKAKDEVGHLARAFRLTIDKLLDYQGYIDEVADALQQVSRGSLGVQLHKDYAGQFKVLKEGMQGLLDNLNSTLLQIDQASDQVQSGAEQLAYAAQALSHGATEQASATEELSASILEISEQIRRNAEYTKAAHDKSEFAGKEIQLSNDQMRELKAAMDQITTRSSEISNIIKIIEDIAFQTNILALNAAVEAARAGAAGKGFSVVADEVRNLAGKSAEAAKNTTILIEQTLKAVENGSQITGKTAALLIQSEKATLDVVSLVDEIAVASQEQASAITHINQGVEQISSVIQTNAATAEESAAASAELSEQSRRLKQLISQFELRGIGQGSYGQRTQAELTNRY